MATQFEGGKALVAGPLKKDRYLAASLTWPLMRSLGIYKFLHGLNFYDTTDIAEMEGGITGRQYSGQLQVIAVHHY